MNLFEDMEIFVQVVESGSFSDAARALHVSPAKISIRISRLERELKTTLFDRTTRNMLLTANGAIYYTHCKEVLSQIAETRAKLHGATENLVGHVRVDVPVMIADYLLLPVLPGFFERFPEITLEVIHSEHVMDLRHQSCDLLIRTGPLEDSSLIGVPLGYSRIVTVAAPSYLDRYGEPQSPQDLHAHNCLQFENPDSGRNVGWVFRKGDQDLELETTGNLVFNQGESRIAAAVQGMGIYHGFEFSLLRWIESGALRIILADWQFMTRPIVMAYPQNKFPTSRLRALIDYLRAMYPPNTEIRPHFK